MEEINTVAQLKFASQHLFNLICFIGILYYFLKKPVSSFFVNRSKNIEESINGFFFGKFLPPLLTVYVMSHLGVKSLLQYFYIFYRNSKMAKSYALISTSEAFLSVFFSILLVIQGEGIVGYSLGQLLGVTILLLGLIFLSILKKEISFKHNLLKENLILSLPLPSGDFFPSRSLGSLS